MLKNVNSPGKTNRIGPYIIIHGPQLYGAAVSPWPCPSYKWDTQNIQNCIPLHTICTTPSLTLVQHCTIVIQMLCVCWVVVLWGDKNRQAIPSNICNRWQNGIQWLL